MKCMFLSLGLLFCAVHGVNVTIKNDTKMKLDITIHASNEAVLEKDRSRFSIEPNSPLEVDLEPTKHTITVYPFKLNKSSIEVQVPEKGNKTILISKSVEKMCGRPLVLTEQ